MGVTGSIAEFAASRIRPAPLVRKFSPDEWDANSWRVYESYVAWCNEQCVYSYGPVTFGMVMYQIGYRMTVEGSFPVFDKEGDAKTERSGAPRLVPGCWETGYYQGVYLVDSSGVVC